MEKQLTNSGPLRESTCKHSIYSKGWLRLYGLPVRVRLGRGAAHVTCMRRSPLLKEPEWVSNQSPGLWDKKPMRILAFRDAVPQDIEHARYRLIPGAAS
jgi:hypothetical protein